MWKRRWKKSSELEDGEECHKKMSSVYDIALHSWTCCHRGSLIRTSTRLGLSKFHLGRERVLSLPEGLLMVSGEEGVTFSLVYSLINCYAS